jgi:alcohol dehydrogenase
MWRLFEPTKLFFGKNSLLENGHLMKELGKRALITTGKSSSRNGSLEDLKKVLDKNGIEYKIYDEVGENPSFDMLRDARKMYENAKIDFVIGVGGGSPMDFAKAIAVLLKNPLLKVSEIYDTEKYSSMLPVVEVPTTSGTGSEVTQYSVITDDEGNKGGFGSDFTFPTLSFVDPRYTTTMPPLLTMSTGIDALCHAIEGFVSKRSNPVSKLLAKEAVEIIKSNLEKAMNEPESYEVREKMMYASTLAGIVIAQSGTTVNHAFGYPLTTFKGIRHGQATGLFLVETLKVMAKEAEKEVNEILETFGGASGLEKFLENLGVYDAKVKISEEEIEKWSQRTSKAKHLRVTPGNFDFDTVKRIYERIVLKLR